jgi:hypothetical protein
MGSTIRTGTVTSVFAVLILILFFVDPTHEGNGESSNMSLASRRLTSSVAPIVLVFCFGRICSHYVVGFQATMAQLIPAKST